MIIRITRSIKDKTDIRGNEENKEEKPVIVSVQSIYSLCDKIEKHSWKRMQNSNEIIFVIV